ncbi:DNA polymerase zeta [Conoideocrella luteorostrata]|uniref:DNA polymerase n=1 Tax=Conoideocrella luteorostrata TaxID=1105319 RepID=A0AAJ0FVG0_9HYPO|nr:DNA polymerase zeta [Conoideocrella luteorostrata]
MSLFRVRLNCIDHYQSSSTRYDPQLRNDVRASQGGKGPKVPVVRIFGSTETGQKVCAHIHGAFPYLYVEYDGDLAPDEVGAYIYRLHLSIDHALAVSYRRDQFGDNAQFVARITVVKGIPFYGFHVGFRVFLKIYMFNPVVMTRLADLLQQGVILKRKFQPYEAHLQYLLQFMVDYNLYGCDYVDSSKTAFRSPVPEYDSASNSSHIWHSQSVLPEDITDEPSLPRLSHCSIEVDICVQHIANRKMVKERPLHHDFIERNAPIPRDLKLVHSMAGLWRDETKRRQRQMPRGSSGRSPFPPEVLVTMSADPRQSQPQGWIHEQEYRRQIENLVEAELSGSDNQTPNFADFAKQVDPRGEIQTVLEAVEDLYPNRLIPALGLSSTMVQSPGGPASSIEVDDKRIMQDLAPDEEDFFFPEDSDEEALRALVPTQNEDDVNQIIEKIGHAPTEFAADKNTAFTNALKLPELRTGLMFGLGHSIFKTGSFPIMPVTQALLDAAEEEGLVGRTIKPAPIQLQQKLALKRSGSALLADNNPQKRLKHSEFSSPLANEIVVRGITPTPPSAQPPPPSTQPPPTSTQPRPDLFTPKINSSYSVTSLGENSNKKSNTGLCLSQPNQPSKQPPNQNVQSSYEKSEDTKISTTSSPIISSSLSQEDDGDDDDDMTKIQRAIAQVITKPYMLYSTMPPTVSECLALRDENRPDVIYQDAFYSKEKDVPQRIREYGGREYRPGCNTLPFLPEFDANGWSAASFGIKDEMFHQGQILEKEQAQQRRQCTWRSWEFAQLPPSNEEVVQWMEDENRKQDPIQNNASQRPSPTRKAWISQIDGPTPKNKYGFRYTQRAKSTSVEHEVQYMSTMSLEIHVNTRGKYFPNPEEDEIECIFWACKSDEMMRHSQSSSNAVQSGIAVLSPDGKLGQMMRKSAGVEVVQETSELDLLVRMVEVVRTHDPDILTGYEVHGSSWGYLIERARFKYDYNLCDEFSRMKSDSHGRFGRQSDRWGFNTTSTIRVTGRHMINIWRAMRGELNLLQYTLENVAWHLLHRRVPHYSWKTMTSWYTSGRIGDLSRLMRYYLSRTMMDIEILETNELISRTSEQARLLGVDFFSVFSRGSQFKVESIMFRIAKPENFMLISPSRKQVGSQNALECLPLVMEPQSAFYNSPLLVLDFQSLYPSVMIAYNYCYSTFLGRINNWRGVKNKMGFTEYKRQKGLLALLQGYINIAPNGMMYVKTEIRKSLLAKMLTEILETRVMVKSGMKKDKDDKALQQLLNNRQLALKLLANVTYGYTSASFSGRMPCSEIADSIVQTARETLERATAYIHSVGRWGAEVVYGDTDSLFVHLHGRTRAQAFDIGNEIAKAITDMNPRPIKLKFEKVYHPCVLLAKKRYVGYKYESKDQITPDFDAKGIETVRRDGTPAEQKIEEKALRLLFETADLSEIKKYFQRQCRKIMRGSVSVQDFCFAKEVRLGTYSDKGVPPAGALISTKKMLKDARAEPQYGERVPYVVITGAPGARLVDRSVSPEDLLANPHWQLDAHYYISKNIIPPLERIFNLVGANVRQWYDEMPKIQRIRSVPTGPTAKKGTLESYMRSRHCLLCNAKFAQQRHHLCPACRSNTPATLFKLQTRLTAEERRFQDVVDICRTCSGLSPLEEVRCISQDCPVFWTRTKQRMKLAHMRETTGSVIRALAEPENVINRAALEW